MWLKNNKYISDLARTRGAASTWCSHRLSKSNNSELQQNRPDQAKK